MVQHHPAITAVSMGASTRIELVKKPWLGVSAAKSRIPALIGNGGGSGEVGIKAVDLVFIVGLLGRRMTPPFTRGRSRSVDQEAKSCQMG